MTRPRDPESPYRYDGPHRRSVAENADYRLTRPSTLNGMLRKLNREYAAEPPAALHTASLMDAGGVPAMTGRALGYLGFHQCIGHDDAHLRLDGRCVTCETLPEKPKDNEWEALACRRDDDGFYTTPWRCAIERIPDPARRAFIRDLATNVFFPRDVARAHGIPDWCATEVTYRSLEIVYSVYLDRPLPGPRKVSHLDKSESQVAAEDAVA